MSTYRASGKRFLRKYTEPHRSPVSAVEIEAQTIVRDLCSVPWEAVADRFAQTTSHTESELDANVQNRNKFDAALFCAEHSDGQHRAYANVATYRYTMPDSAVGNTLQSIKATVNTDYFNSQGARLHVFTNSTGEIPMNCHTVRGEDANGDIIEDGTTASGVAKRTVTIVNNQERWHAATEVVTLSPTGGLALQKYLFLVVALESYSTVRVGSNWLEGSSFISNDVQLTLASACADLDADELNDLVERSPVRVFYVARGGITQDNYGASSGRYALCMSRNGDDLDDVFKARTGVDQDVVGNMDYDLAPVPPETPEESDVVGLRALYAKFYLSGLKAVPRSAQNLRTGAGFAVQYGTLSGKYTASDGSKRAFATRGWRMVTASLVIPFSAPTDSPSGRIWFGWGVNGSGGPSNGGQYNFWLKRGEYVNALPDATLRKPDIYFGGADVDGWEFLGRTDAQSLAAKEITLPLAEPLKDRVASVMVTAFAGQDELAQVDGPGAFAPIGVPVDAAGGFVDGEYGALRPSVALISGDGDAQPEDSFWGLTFTAEEAGSTVAMEGGEGAPAVSLETSTDNGRTWTPFVIGTTTITLANVGDSVCFRAGDGGTGGDGLNVVMSLNRSVCNSFTATGRIAASGDISSLLDRTGTVRDLTGRDNCFATLFRGCTSLVSAPELPATTLANYCYCLMFRGCTSLVSAPELPATTLAVSCYYMMFDGCTSLVSAPELPATTLAGSCYGNMFRDCTSLVSAPELPATTLAGNCYHSMFRGCTSLVSAPELPATTLTVNCYHSMFLGCTSLGNVKVHFAAWNDAGESTLDWLNGVADSGTFECPEGLDTTTRHVSRVPEGWTVQTT